MSSVTARVIGPRAGVSAMTVSNQFEGIDGLYLELIDQALIAASGAFGHVSSAPDRYVPAFDMIRSLFDAQPDLPIFVHQVAGFVGPTKGKPSRFAQFFADQWAQQVKILAGRYIPRSSLRAEKNHHASADGFLHLYFHMAFIMALRPGIDRHAMQRCVLGP